MMIKFKQLLVPAVIILMGAGAAFATNAAKDSDDGMVDAYYFDNTTRKCIEVEDAQCTTDFGQFCTWTDPSTDITHILRELEGTSCTKELYRQP